MTEGEAVAAPQPASGAAAGPGPGSGPGGISRWADIGGPVHYLDFGGPAYAPVIVCVHGLDGCAVNWSALAPLLTSRYRVLAPDLAGHGLTRAAGWSTGVTANRSLLHDFIEAVAGGPVILMGNSMGGMISLMEASHAPGLVTALILVDPALPFVPGPARPDGGEHVRALRRPRPRAAAGQPPAASVARGGGLPAAVAVLR